MLNNHEEWHDEIWLDDCPATFLPKGANARNHEVENDKRNHQTSSFGRFFVPVGKRSSGNQLNKSIETGG
jgi:hypothetical protein